MNHSEKIAHLKRKLVKSGHNARFANPPVLRFLALFGVNAKPPLFWNYGELFAFYFSFMLAVGCAIEFGTPMLTGGWSSVLLLATVVGLVASVLQKAFSPLNDLPKWENYPSE